MFQIPYFTGIAKRVSGAVAGRQGLAVHLKAQQCLRVEERARGVETDVVTLAVIAGRRLHGYVGQEIRAAGTIGVRCRPAPRA